MTWSTAEAIVQQLQRRWNRGDILAARVTGTVLFPMEISLRRPTPRDIAERFGEVSDWATALREASVESMGFGFELRRESVRNRVQGSNDLPVVAVVPREIDALRLIRQQAATERFQALVDHNKLFLYTQKTGTAVYVPLPPAAVKALGQLEGDGEHFFTSGKAKPQTARANWSRYLDTVFALAKVKDAHSHRFRDTFAVSLLENGVSLENLSVLLGHSSVRITERHYKPWVKTLQKKLEEEVQKAWR